MSNKISEFFELGKAEQGDWFSYFESKFEDGEIVYDDPKEDAVEFCIRGMGAFFEEANRGRKKESKMVRNPVERKMERVPYYPDLPVEDEQKQAEDAWEFAIIGARKKKEDGGYADIVMSREDKLALIKIPKLLRFFQRVFQILTGEVESKAETEAKNSSTS